MNLFRVEPEPSSVHHYLETGFLLCDQNVVATTTCNHFVECEKMKCNYQITPTKNSKVMELVHVPLQDKLFYNFCFL